MYIIERLRDLFHPHSDVATDIEYFCYDCYGIFHCMVDLKGTDWNTLAVICRTCKNKRTIIHRINGKAINAD